VNLLGNSLKFTRRGRVSLTATLHGDTGVRISVSDEGCGVPQSAIDTLFDPFKQVCVCSSPTFHLGHLVAACRCAQLGVAETHGQRLGPLCAVGMCAGVCFDPSLSDPPRMWRVGTCSDGFGVPSMCSGG
jgi:light-regulated signal transduction histidine kinase (bacteriophytochrome)